MIVVLSIQARHISRAAIVLFPILVATRGIPAPVRAAEAPFIPGSGPSTTGSMTTSRSSTAFRSSCARNGCSQTGAGERHLLRSSVWWHTGCGRHRRGRTRSGIESYGLFDVRL